MECNKLGLEKRFLKVRAKVTGFLIAKIEKRNTPEQVIIAKKRNTILTTGLQNLLNAFQTYMSGVTYLGVNAPSTGIVITTSSGTQSTLSFLTPPAISLESNSIILSFTVRDDTTSSYTATSEELITRSAGYNIPIATANLSITKNSDEILTMTWIITISVSPSGNIQYIPTLTPQESGASCGYCGGGCNICNQTSANSEYAYGCSSGCQLYGLTSQYPQSNFVTSILFSDIFYNTYSKGSSNSLTYASGTTLIIYTLYCLEYFVVGLYFNSPMFSAFASGGGGCFTPGTPNIVTTAYLQVYSPSQTAPYIGVQIEFTT